MGVDLPVIYYRRAVYHLGLATSRSRIRSRRDRKEHLDLALANLQVAIAGARIFPDEGKWMGDSGNG